MNKRILLTLLPALLLCSSAIALADTDIDESLNAKPDGKVRIEVERGDIEVRTWSKALVHVEGEVNGSDERFIFRNDGDETFIKVEVEDGFFDKHWNNTHTDLTIHVPEGSRVIAGGVSTDFDVRGVQGGVEVNSVSGDIVIENAMNRVTAQTVSGDIRVRDSSGRMNLSSVSGDIDSSGEANYFDAQTVSGDLDAKIGKADIVQLTSVSGDIDLRFALQDDGRVDAETVSGDIDLRFDNSTVNARFDINTGPGGDIRNNLTNDRPESSFIGSEEINFKSGNGSATVEISTMSGSISLDK